MSTPTWRAFHFTASILRSISGTLFSFIQPVSIEHLLCFSQSKRWGGSNEYNKPTISLFMEKHSRGGKTDSKQRSVDMLMVISPVEKNEAGKGEKECQDLAEGVIMVGL